MTRANNPLECGLEAYCQLDGHEFIGQDALCLIAEKGVQRQMRGIRFNGKPCPTCSIPWPIIAQCENGQVQVGQITSAIYSPRLQQNVGQSMLERGFWDAGQIVTVNLPDGSERKGEVVVMPFF